MTAEGYAGSIAKRSLRLFSKEVMPKVAWL
jgi:hypothetical protein